MGKIGKNKTNHASWKRISIQRVTEGNPNWKADDVTVSSVHCWVRRNFTKPDSCEICGRINDGSKRFDWSNKDYKYTRIRDEWQFVCRSCHNFYDQEHNGRILNHSKLNGKWSMKYTACTKCGRNNVKYKAGGMCSKCYQS